MVTPSRSLVPTRGTEEAAKLLHPGLLVGETEEAPNAFETVILRKRLNPPFLGDLTIGLVDGRNLLCGDRDELLGHAAGHQFIGMVFQHQPAVVIPSARYC